MTIDETVNNSGISNIAIAISGIYISGIASLVASEYTANYFLYRNDEEAGCIVSSAAFLSTMLAGLKITSYLLEKYSRRKAL